MVRREHLLEWVWRDWGDGNVRPMHTMVSKLRRKLSDHRANPIYIFTERGVGYRMPKGKGKARNRPPLLERRALIPYI